MTVNYDGHSAFVICAIFSMKKISILFLLLCCTVSAQTYEIGFLQVAQTILVT